MEGASRRSRKRGPSRGRGGVRGGINSRAALQLAQGSVVDDVAVRAEHGAHRRPGPSNIDELLVYDIGELPVVQPLETPLHVKRKRVWQPSQSPPLSTVCTRSEPSSTSHKSASSSSGEGLNYSAPVSSASPASPTLLAEMEVECGGSALGTPPQRSSMTHSPPHFPQIGCGEDVVFGSEPGSDESDDDELMAPQFIPRVFRSTIETPIEEDDVDTIVLPAAEEAALSGEFEDVPPKATDQPWRWYDFDWREFPSASVAPELRREAFSQSNVGPTTPCVDPYEIFISIWDRQFMEYIASETNRYAQQVASHLMETNRLQPNSRIGQWKDTTADELYVYFGITIAMGVVVKSRMEEYWGATPDIFYTPGFSAHMSISRYLLLSKCLHFNNNDDMCALELDASEARLFKIQPVLSHLNMKFQSLYTPKQNIALDESLLQWKGWLAINQFIPNKAASVGIKTYEICESRTGYLWRFEIHAHKKSPPHQLEDPLQASTPSIVLRLIQGLENKGYTLWMDNFYNSPCLARRLKVLGFDCVGTLSTNRRFVPQALHSLTKGNMAKGQVTGLTSGDVDVMVWRDNNRVAMLSTYHGIEVARDGAATKPIMVLDYNIMMGGVDKKDQMLAMYPIERKRTRVWYKKFFKRLLNASVLNSYIIQQQSARLLSLSNPSVNLSHRNYRLSLIKSLLSKHCSGAAAAAASFPPNIASISATSLPLRYDAAHHYTVLLPMRTTGSQRLRRKCCVCGNLSSYMCRGCGNVMCIDSCFHHVHSL